MKSKNKVWALMLLVVLTVSAVSACGGAAPEMAPAEDQPATTDGEDLLQARCGECHGTSQVTGASKTQDEWEATVARMIGHGAELNDDEQVILVEYLAQTYGP